jgi:hypothetical protein
LQDVISVEGEGEHHHHERSEGYDLVQEDSPTPLDRQVLACDHPRDA